LGHRSGLERAARDGAAATLNRCGVGGRSRDWSRIHCELDRKGVTPVPLWQKYVAAQPSVQRSPCAGGRAARAGGFMSSDTASI